MSTDFFANLGEAAELARTAMDRLEAAQAVERLNRRDAALWGEDPEHQAVARRSMGWLELPRTMAAQVDALRRAADEARGAGYTRAVLLGMGGSSLAADMARHVFGVESDYLDLAVLDSTHPAAVRAVERSGELERTLFLVASKSGTTQEVASFYRYFRRRAPGEDFVAITDPGTPLDELAGKDGFRRIWRNPPDLGGRYSALSYFGLLPMALLGVDLELLLARAGAMAEACRRPTRENPGARLAAALGGCGRDKVTMILPPPLSPFGWWLEQLMAESTGKKGRGLVPVEGEALGPPEVYGPDRLFIRYVLEGFPDRTADEDAADLIRAGCPVLTIPLRDLWDLGGEIFRWEAAVALTGFLLGIDPFDQPNVQESKDRTRKLLEGWRDGAALPEAAPFLQADGIACYGDPLAGDTPAAVLRSHLARARSGDYLAIQAFWPPSPEATEILSGVRERVRDKLRLATTAGYGPRYLHSTGQLHKGGPDEGLFLQLTAGETAELPIPGEAYGFGTLHRAQAQGDLEALRDRGRRVLRLHFLGGTGELERLEALTETALEG